MSIVKRELPKYLGGTWDITIVGSPIKVWYDDTYSMRNKIVHAGYYPTSEEAYLSINGAINFRDFILDRVRSNKKKYLRLNEYFTK